MKKISRKEFLKKDVYIMYRSKEEYKKILKFIEDNFESVRWDVDGKKPTEFDFNEWAEMTYLGFINMDNNKLYDNSYIICDNENKLMLSYSEFVEFVKLFDTELLSEYEKEYITGMIKALRINIDYVIKKNPESSDDYLCISIDSDGANVLCLYAACTFEGLEENEKYTLDELGIDINAEQQKHKITLSEFWSKKKLMAIHCNTEEKANKLLKAFDKLGKKWCGGGSYISYNNYKNYKDRTCYSNNGGYSSYEWHEKNDYIIYEFDEVDLEN